MREYVIDGERFSTLEEFYQEISEVLVPGVFWGRNLAAFEDILRGGFGTPDEGFVLRWKNSNISRERLGYPETIREVEDWLRTCLPINYQYTKSQLEKAQNHEGPTVFDWLVDIINVNKENGVELILE